MNPTVSQVLAWVNAGQMPQLLRGEVGVFTTPPEINADMRPTDHSLLLLQGIYPLVGTLPAPVVADLLERGLRSICTDARGVYCAVQCFYLQVVDEDAGKAPFSVDRQGLVDALYAAFLAFAADLHALTFLPADLALDRRFKLTQAAFRVLQRDHRLAPSGLVPGQAYP